MQPGSEDKGLAWQIGVWIAWRSLTNTRLTGRLTSVVDGVVQRAGLQAGEQVLDLGTGTGTVAIRGGVARRGRRARHRVDISGEMLAVARERVCGARTTERDLS